MYKVLIVEDEMLIRKRLVYGFDFDSLNCVVVGEARDGQEGVEKIKNTQPDIVLTDINMPVMDAFDMLEEAMDYDFSTIILSGYDEFANAQKAIKYGVSEFIVKPINEEELTHAIRRATKQVEEQKTFELVKKLNPDFFTDHAFKPNPKAIKDPVVRQMLEYIERNYSEKIVFKEVSKELGYSTSLMYEKFRNELDTTFNDYLNRYRINKSIELIKEDQYLIYEIAEMCGFSEYKYYNKVFKKYIGVSTTDFLKSM